jgi:hypothetical protein
LPSGVSADTGDYPSEVPVALSRKSFPPRRQFMRRARCSSSAGPPESDHAGGVAKSSATSATTSTSTTALARCETRRHNRGRCPGLDCRIPIQQQHPRPRLLTQSPSAQPIRRTPAASTPKSGRTVHRYGILADTPTMPRPASHSRLSEASTMAMEAMETGRIVATGMTALSWDGGPGPHQRHIGAPLPDEPGDRR